MSRKIDDNGFITFENVLISREGVFDYSGEQIDDPNHSFGLDPNALYKVYRPKTEVCSKSFIDSLEKKPLIDDHTMLGADYVPAEEKGIHGVLTDVHAEGNELFGTITVWSEALKSKIDDGKRELSLGYTGRFKRSPGMFMGQKYDFVMYDLSANHIALVDDARMGHSCRIMDRAVISDSLELPRMGNKEEKDKKTCADELIETLKGCSDEELAKVKDYLSGLEEKKPGEDAAAKADDDKKAGCEDEDKDKKLEDSDKVLDSEGKDNADDGDKGKEDEKDACEDKCADSKDKGADVVDKKSVADAAIKSYKEMVEMANSDEFKTCFGEVSLDGVNTCAELAQKVCLMDAALKFVSPGKALDAIKGRMSKAPKKERTTISDSASASDDFDFASAFQSRK